jgi:hypothetical protein
MARLVVKTDGFNEQVIELKLGVNQFGRGPANDFQIEHPTVSTKHCELSLEEGEILVRDCDSTNGTFVNGEAVREARLRAGETFCMGDVEFYVENTDLKVAIPKFDLPRPAPPVVLSDGGLICPRHAGAQVTHQCTNCREVLCDACVTRLRRRGGKTLKLCCICSHDVVPLGGAKPKRKGLFGFLHKTVKMSFLRTTKIDGL